MCKRIIGYFYSSVTIWTPGIEGFDITIEPQIEKTKDGRIIVNEFCQNQKFPNLFCIGDISAILDPSGGIQNPPLGQFAISKAVYLAESISKYFINGKKPKEIFSYEVDTRILSLGINDYIGMIGNIIIEGSIAKIIKEFINKAHLDSLYSRGTSIFTIFYKHKDLYNLLIGIAIGYFYQQDGGNNDDSIRIFNQKDVLKKGVRGLGDFDIGEVKKVSDKYLITEKGIIRKNRYYIPKNSIIHIDRQYVWVGITEKEAKQYKKD